MSPIRAMEINMHLQVPPGVLPSLGCTCKERHAAHIMRRDDFIFVTARLAVFYVIILFINSAVSVILLFRCFLF